MVVEEWVDMVEEWVGMVEEWEVDTVAGMDVVSCVLFSYLFHFPSKDCVFSTETY